MKNIKKILGSAIFTLFLSSAVLAEGVPTNPPAALSIVSGTVLDNVSGETLAGVAVSIEGTDTKVYTDLDGKFIINDLKPGTYNLILSMISYKNSLVENVSLLPNENEKMEIKLDNK